MSGQKNWRSRAACRGVDPELFFPTAEDGPVRDAQVAVAKSVCASCPVREACLAEALERMPYGIAGGLTPEERRGQRRRLPEIEREIELEEGLRPGAGRAQVAVAGRVLLLAGRPAREVAARCGVTERTVSRWAGLAKASLAEADDSPRTHRNGHGGGKPRRQPGSPPDLPSTEPLAGTQAAEGHRS